MSFWQDLRFAVRLLIKDKWFTTVAALALALGIGVNSTVFTFVNAVLIRGLPFDDPDRIMSLGTKDARNRDQGLSYLEFKDWLEASRSASRRRICSPCGSSCRTANIPRWTSGAISTRGSTSVSRR